MRESSPLVVILVIAMCSVVPTLARAVEIRDARVLLLEQDVTVALRTAAALSPRVRSSLERGMPATVQLSVELWRVRPGWFDQRVHLQQTEIRIARDAWSDEYEMQRDVGPRITVPDLEEVDYQLTRPMRVRLVPASTMEPVARHYVIARVEVKPLTAEDIEEVEGWLSGEAKRAGKPGPGSIARLPKSMMVVLANLSGFGNEVAQFRGGTFTRGELVPRRTP